MSLFEMLESRSLLSVTPGLPSLTGTLSVKKSTIAAANQTVSATLDVTNAAGDLAQTSVPIGIYVDGTFLTTINTSLAIKGGKSKKVPLKFTLPDSDALPSGTYTLTAQIDDGGSVPELPDTNGAATTTLFNPIGTYSGTYQVGSDQESLDITIFSSDGKLESNVDADGETFGSLSATNAKTTIAGKGKFSSVAVGSEPSHDVSKFTLSIKGNINTSTESISGPFSFSGKGANGPFKGHGTFTVMEERPA